MSDSWLSQGEWRKESFKGKELVRGCLLYVIQWLLVSVEGGKSLCRSRRVEEREGYSNMCTGTHMCARTHIIWVIFVLYSGL